MTEDMFRIGVITEPHGIKGEVKVFCTSDEPAHLKKVKKVLLVPTKGDEKELTMKQVRLAGQFLIVQFEEVTDRNAAETLRKAELYVERKDAVPLQQDEYYINDLIGLKVVDENDLALGTLTEVIPTGANDVYEITLSSGEQLLLPAIKQCILSVNVPDGYIKVHVLEGLM